MEGIEIGEKEGNTQYVVCGMTYRGDCGSAEIAVPLHRRKDIITNKDIITYKQIKDYETNV